MTVGNKLQTHPREDRDYDDPFLGGRVLPPLQLYPLTAKGDLLEETRAAIDEAILEATEYLGKKLPKDVTCMAVEYNFVERIRKAVDSLDAFFESRGATPDFRKVFSMHEHISPEGAAIFFNNISDLPSIDLVSAVCTPDTRDLVTETLKVVGRNFYDEIVTDDVPRVIVETFNSDDGEDYVLITAKKIVARRKDMVFKRRKTYVAKSSDLKAHGLTDTEKLQQLLSDGNQTPEYLVSIIESVFVERSSIIQPDS